MIFDTMEVWPGRLMTSVDAFSMMDSLFDGQSHPPPKDNGVGQGGVGSRNETSNAHSYATFLAPLVPTSISTISPGGREIHLIAIVLSCQAVQFVQSSQKHLRRIRIADASGSIDVTLWGDAALQVAPSDILVFRRAYATLYKGRLTLYTGDRGEVKRVGQFSLPFTDRPYLSDPLTHNWSLPELEDRLRARGQLLEPAPAVNPAHSRAAEPPQKRRRKNRKRSHPAPNQKDHPRPVKLSKPDL